MGGRHDTYHKKTDPFKAKYVERKRGRERGREKEMRDGVLLVCETCSTRNVPGCFRDNRQALCPVEASEESRCVLSTP